MRASTRTIIYDDDLVFWKREMVFSSYHFKYKPKSPSLHKKNRHPVFALGDLLSPLNQAAMTPDFLNQGAGSFLFSLSGEKAASLTTERRRIRTSSAKDVGKIFVGENR